MGTGSEKRKYRVQIMDAKLLGVHCQMQNVHLFRHIKRLRLTEKASHAFLRKWDHNQLYMIPYTRTETLVANITPGVLSYTISNLNLARLCLEVIPNLQIFRVPYRLTVVLVPQRLVLGGDYKRNPVEFDHHNLRSITFDLAERKLATYHCNFEQNDFIEPYLALKESFSSIVAKYDPDAEALDSHIIPNFIVDPKTFRERFLLFA